MMKIYTYCGIDYKSERAVRQAVFNEERMAFPVCKTPEDWAKYGIDISEVDVEFTEEQLAQQARSKRDNLLRYSDYYVMPDYPATEEGLAEVKAYRQALRDITKQEGFPDAVTWPSVPDVLA